MSKVAIKEILKKCKNYLQPIDIRTKGIKVSIKEIKGPDADGVWIPIVVNIKDKCFAVCAFCNTGFGYPKDESGNSIRVPCIALPASLLLLEKVISYREFMDALLSGEELLSITDIRDVDVGLLDEDIEFRWIKAWMWLHTKPSGRVLLNPELWINLGVAYDTREWKERLWFPAEKPSLKKKSMPALVFEWEFES